LAASGGAGQAGGEPDVSAFASTAIDEGPVAQRQRDLAEAHRRAAIIALLVDVELDYSNAVERRSSSAALSDA